MIDTEMSFGRLLAILLILATFGVLFVVVSGLANQGVESFGENFRVILDSAIGSIMPDFNIQVPF